MFQTVLRLPPLSRGFHLITRDIENAVSQSGIRTGLVHLLLQHTSASLCLGENADPSVRRDMETFFSDLADAKRYYLHTYEGADDMPAHIKSAVLGVSLTLPLSGGQLALGTWQGIYLGEHREHGGRRSIVITAAGT